MTTTSAAMPPKILHGFDDTSPVEGEIGFGQYTNDSAPIIRVAIDAAGSRVGDTVYLTDTSVLVGPTITLAADDLSRGYVDIAVSGLSEGWHPFIPHQTTADGTSVGNSPYFAIGVAVQPPAIPEVRQATDNVGASQGVVARGTTTDDATLTFTLVAPDAPPLPQGSPGHPPYGGPPILGGQIRLYADGALVGSGPIGFGGVVEITTSALADGVHNFTAMSVDRAGNVSGAAQAFTLTIGPDTADPRGADGQVLTSDQYGDTLTGGSGDDVLHAGQGPDTLTGGGGADRFVFSALPWNAGHITDFVVGTDHLDIDALLAASGYFGADPVADRYVRFEADGAGGTKVYLDTDGPDANAAWPTLITVLDHVPAAGLSATNILAGGGRSTPPAGQNGPPAGQVLTSDKYGDTLAGGPGDDVFYAGQGPDALTGGGGIDRFVFAHLPWTAGHITDFAVSQDLLDLRALFTAAGYAGTSPVADGYLRLEGDGSGGMKVYFDSDGAGSADPWGTLITTLDGVALVGDAGTPAWLLH